MVLNYKGQTHSFLEYPHYYRLFGQIWVELTYSPSLVPPPPQPLSARPDKLLSFRFQLPFGTTVSIITVLRNPLALSVHCGFLGILFNIHNCTVHHTPALVW